MTAPIITGYYRYTDIWFEWAQVLPEKDAQVLKATLAHDAIVHSDHPLHVDGVNGVQMYIGTFHSGEERLMFSSKQVDYIRYWLHAMKLTESEIPLPYSECLLLHGDGDGDDIRFITEVVYKTGGDLRGAIKGIDKKNKKLKGSSPRLIASREVFNNVQKLFKEKKHVFLAIDIESWEMEHDLITEFGYSVIHWEGEREVNVDGHWIVKEYETYLNGKYVAENRKNYIFGKSEVLSKAAFKKRVHELLEHYQSLGAVFLVFHDASGDIKYLKSKMVEAPLDGISYVLPDTSPDKGLYVADTSDLFAALEGEGSKNRRGLAKICDLLKIDTRFLHNAGNDAHYTLMACKEMAGGDTLIAQRDTRWPECVVPGSAKLNFYPHQENSDFSDEEGILG
ncbi:hypothetical protein PQX77_000254 [Marasmius sp. AFHP31]|nr:hypothetical protein PQX77_000254 [Marasmius sp. AFHP31]